MPRVQPRSRGVPTLPIGQENSWYMQLFKPTTWSTEELERLGVRCWNARYGCEDKGSVSEMLLHLKRMRRYHAIRCRRCHAAVLHRQIVRHLDSDCEGYRIAGEQSVRHDVADCFRNASAPERHHLASDEIGATQAVSKATFDPGVVRNTSAASNDNVGDYSGENSSESAFSTITRRVKRNSGGAENVIAATALAPTVELPGSLWTPM
ncbi:hypothetical protein HPB51_001061 [Rhipicephalus microplus]|uniref:Uncharacterized protein n=1 Tax=Rhipicephalus microplus TaxID=6941 RepID=A0A9J6DR43_RHIMP|nr:hypothetical protein HPB51_001061 [Rhipicephalus microplus]